MLVLSLLKILKSKIISDSLSQRQGKMKCSSCYHLMEEVSIFRMTQLRNFGRQSNRLKARNITLGKYKRVGGVTLEYLYTYLHPLQ